eukprot:Sspe_Gene.66551::Locus_39313_Transcript_1_1_Confidence_1.000_Length_1770::g.66551::m.66551
MLRAVALSLALTVASASGPGYWQTCFVPATTMVYPESTCDTLKGNKTVELAGLVGEEEHVQVLVAAPTELARTVQATFAVHGLAGVEVTQVGYVNCTKTKRYEGSGGGWHPDPLLPIDGPIAVVPNIATPVWLTIPIPSHPVSGTIAIDLGVVKYALPITLTPWKESLPTAERIHESFGEIWSFNAESVTEFYKNRTVDISRFQSMLTDSLLPPDALYKQAPYANLSTYAYLANTGSYLLNLADIGTDPKGCPEPYDDKHVQTVLAMLEPAVESILEQRKGVPYVYGYDEQSTACEANIRKLYGAVKERWGSKVLTVATLNWEPPVDLPVDIWVLQYENYEKFNVSAWKAAGKKQYWYHCIEPSGEAYLNTFIERPRTQGRMLYWLAAANNVDGWLYYATALWRAYPGTEHTPIRKVKNTPMTDFNPANYIWSPRTDIFSNGDGQFIYPGEDSTGPIPVASARLRLMRDAVEDQVLISMAKAKAGETKVNELIRKVVQSPTVHNDDPVLLEETRRQIAALL